MRRLLRNLVIVLFGAILAEQVVLYLVGRSLTPDPTIAKRFVADLAAAGDTVTSTCLRYDTALIYSYRICAREISGRDHFEVRLTFPAGYLTLIPRDYADRALFDGRSLALVDEFGAIFERADP